MDKNSSEYDYHFDLQYEPHTNKILEPVILRHIRESRARTVLDIGCGNGAIARAMAAGGVSVVGVDPSETGIDAARQKCPTGQFHVFDIYDDPEKIPEREFDLAVSTEVVEHLLFPRELLRFAHQKLKKGGTLLISTPYHGYLKNLAICLMGKWDDHHTVLWDGGHVKFWSRATLSRLLEEEGFEVVGFHGCGRAPLLWESMVLIGRKKNR